jgi:transposase-like protein
MQKPSAGQHYPGSLGEFQSWFRTDADCRDYLAWLRWPDGFVCSKCDNRSGWETSNGGVKCYRCDSLTSPTAGTIFDGTRTPLTVWFMACWLLTSGKDGISALSLKRTLSIGSYQTSWAILHRLRSALVRPYRERLTGTVQVDETYIGGVEPGLPGGRAKGKKALVAIAVEMRGENRLGRCRMQVVPDASGEALQAFVHAHVEPDSTVVTDGWLSYPGLVNLGYKHEARNQSAAKARGKDSGELLKGVHRIASLAKRWLLGTHQGAVRNSHLPAYLNEFTFRFNRRSSRLRGMLFFRALELAVIHEPVRYNELVAEQRTRDTPPTAPGRYGHPPSLDRPPEDRPWRRVGR